MIVFIGKLLDEHLFKFLLHNLETTLALTVLDFQYSP